jgi:hypothetical protein
LYKPEGRTKVLVEAGMIDEAWLLIDICFGFGNGGMVVSVRRSLRPVQQKEISF